MLSCITQPRPPTLPLLIETRRSLNFTHISPPSPSTPHLGRLLLGYSIMSSAPPAHSHNLASSHPQSSVPIPIAPSPSHLNRTSSLSRPPRRASQSTGTPNSTLGRRPSRATHPPMAPNRPLSHDEALEALRGFLKERSSYDVFPVSFRLIVLDAQLKVKKALDVMLLYGEWYQQEGRSSADV